MKLQMHSFGVWTAIRRVGLIRLGEMCVRCAVK